MDKNGEKKYYKTSEAAEIIGVAPSTLRFWEGEFPSLRPKRNDKGTRFYSQADMERLRMIKYLLKHRGMHIERARREMIDNPQGVERLSRAVGRLEEIRAKLQGLIDAIDSMS